MNYLPACNDPPAFKPDTPPEIIYDWLVDRTFPVPLEQAVEWYAAGKLPQKAFLLFMRTVYPEQHLQWLLGMKKATLKKLVLDATLYGRAKVPLLYEDADKPVILDALDFLTIRRECRVSLLEIGSKQSTLDRLTEAGFVPHLPLKWLEDKRERCIDYWQELKPIDMLPPEPVNA